MNAAELNRGFDLLALAGQDTRLRRLGAYHTGPCPFCGGTDRFCVKSTPAGYRWFCRRCGDGKYHTAIDYVMRRQRLDFPAALASMGGAADRTATAPASEPPPRARISLPDAGWQAGALRDLDAAGEQLLHGDDPRGREYLLGRGLHRGVWTAWQLGYASIYDPAAGRARPAILLPWIDMDPDREVLMAVKYRFIDEAPGGLRYLARRGSLPVLYGLWADSPAHHTLLLVEGEFNALSVWQCLPEGVTCLSFGSESGACAHWLEAAARGRERLILWADDPARALALRAAIGRPALPLQSPRRAGLKLDANALLQHGLLMDFLSSLLGVRCLGHPAQRS